MPDTISLNLSTIGLSPGVHSISVVLSDGGVNYFDSDRSNAVSYAVPYPISFTLTGCTKTSGDATILPNGSTTLIFAAASGYALPSASGITVTGATLTSWDKSTGTLVISNPTMNVTVTVVAEAEAQSVKYLIDDTMTLKTTDMFGNSVVFISNGVTYDKFTVKTTSTTKGIYYGLNGVDTIAFDYRSSTANKGWIDQAYRTVEFPNGVPAGLKIETFLANHAQKL